MAKNRVFGPYEDEPRVQEASATVRSGKPTTFGSGHTGTVPKPTSPKWYSVFRRARTQEEKTEEEQQPATATPTPEQGGQPPGNGNGAGDDGSTPSRGDPGTSAGAFTKIVGWSITSVFVGLAAWGCIMAVVAPAGDSDDTGLWWARTFAFATVGLVLLILQSLGGDYGILRPLVGVDGRFSTSLTQIAIWTLAVSTAFAWLIGRVLFAGGELSKLLPPDLWDEYVLLLGGPFAAAVLAKGVVTYKLQAGTLQKSEPKNTSVSQIVTGDDDKTDLVDSQYLLFNLIALGYFVIEVVSSGALPPMPGPLLAMTGSTAALYVANKAAYKNAPTITAVTPKTASPGDVVTVFGTNFDPGDRKDQMRRITASVTGFDATIYSHDSADTYIRFRIPHGTEPGDQVLTVTSTAGVDTEPSFIEINEEG